MKRAFLVLGLITLLAVIGVAFDMDQLEEIAAKDNPTAEEKAYLESYEDSFHTGNVIDEAGGPDGMGYVYKDSQEPDGPVYSWFDNTLTGTEFILASGIGDDEVAGPFNIGPNGTETFTFYGVDYTQWSFESNGIVRFGDDVLTEFGLSDEPLPTDDADLPAVFFFWDDMDADNGALGYYSYEDVGGTMATVITIVGLDEYSGSDTQDTITGQVILYADGRILVQYATIGQEGAGLDINSETMGIQAGTAGPALESSYHLTPASYPFDSLAILYEQLDPDANVEGFVGEMGTNTPIEGAEVTCQGMTAFTDASGFYSIDGLYSGTEVTVAVAAGGYYGDSTTLTLVMGPNDVGFSLEPLPAPIQGDYYTSFEDNGNPFVDDGGAEWEWGMPTAGPAAAHNGDNAWATGLAGNHTDTGGDRWMTTSEFFELGPVNPLVRYWHWFDYNDNYDGYNFNISTDGGATWELLTPDIGYSGLCSYGGYTDQMVFYNDETPPTPGENEWALVTFDLSAYAGQTVQFGFQHIASTVVSYYGVCVDEFEVLTEPAATFTVSGTVTDAVTNALIEGANVTIGTGSAVTDVAGFYTMEVEPGTYDGVASADTYLDATESVTVVDAPVTQNFQLTPEPLANVSGTVTHALYGYAVEGATVNVGVATTTTDADGFYSLTAYYYDTQIEVIAPDFPFYDMQIDIANGDNTVDVALMPFNMDVDVWATDGADVPVGGGTVTYDVYIENNTGGWQTGSLWAKVKLPNGNFYPPAIWNFDYTFLPGYANGLGLTLDVPAGAPAGDYEFHVNIGNFPNVIIFSDFFAFNKAGAGIASLSDAKFSGRAPVLNGPAIASDANDAVSTLPEEFELGKSYPNPFNPTANFSVALPNAAELTVNVYNVMGQQVAQITNGTMSAGLHTLTLDGSALSSGVYFIHASVPGELNAIQKVTLMK